MMRLFRQMLTRPVAALTASVELLGQRLPGRQSVDGVVSRVVHTLTRPPANPPPASFAQAPPPALLDQEPPPALRAVPPPGTRVESAAREARPEASVAGNHNPDCADTDLSGDALKLVRYQVLFVRRGYEHAFTEQEALLAENLDGDAFTAWKIAEFMQELRRGEAPAPAAWRAQNYPPGGYVRNGKLIGLPPEDQKYLRLDYRVLARYPRQRFNFERRQIRVLKQIRDAIRHGDR